jgi:hypothetical protein
MGRAQVGKDTSADMLCAMARGKKIAYAAKLKRIVSELFDIPMDAFETDASKNTPTDYTRRTCPMCGSIEVELLTLDNVKTCRCKVCSTMGEPAPFSQQWTPRTILQHVGTEGFRRVDDRVWTRYALKEARKLFKDPELEFVAVSDVRFKSEADAIWEAGGEVWRIKRPSVEGKIAGLQNHPSETEQATLPDSLFQAVIVNDGSFDDLRAKLTAELQRVQAKWQ